MIRQAKPCDALKCSKTIRDAIEAIPDGVYDSIIKGGWIEYLTPRRLRHQTRGRTRIILYEEHDRVYGVGGIDGSTIEHLYVHPEAASNGVGKSLLSRLERLAGQQGYKSVRLLATLNAEQFYIRNGYQALKLVMHPEGAVEVPYILMSKRLARVSKEKRDIEAFT